MLFPTEIVTARKEDDESKQLVDEVREAVSERYAHQTR